MSSLPTELLIDILRLVLDSHSSASSILLTSSHFYTLSREILLTHLQFHSLPQLQLFLSAYSEVLPCPQRTLTLDFPGSTTKIFGYLYTLLTLCATHPHAEIDNNGRVVLDLLKLRMNSHARDPDIVLVYKALSKTNPRRFIWTGPDPPHHFSIAIVPQAIPHLFRALSTYTNLAHLKLTHLSFFPPSESASTAASDLFTSRTHAPDKWLQIPHIPSLKTLHIGQATFLSPDTVATLIVSQLRLSNLEPEALGSASDLSTGPSRDPAAGVQLERIRLVDAYTESIWGFRLRRSQVEAAAVSLIVSQSDSLSANHQELGTFEVPTAHGSYPEVGQANGSPAVQGNDLVKSRAMELVKRVVVCEAQTERIIGGDRVLAESMFLY